MFFEILLLKLRAAREADAAGW